MKTETQHTPGPWRVMNSHLASNYNVYASHYVDNVGEVADFICEVPSYIGNEANAELIAQAPTLKAQRAELLAALDRLLALHDDQVFVFGVDDETKVYKALDTARAAIAACCERPQDIAKASGKDGGK